MTDQSWSKRLRNRSGGIEAILREIANTKVIDMSAPLCVQLNKDDGSEADPDIVRRYFPIGQVLPHRVEGQNRFRHVHQLIHCAALNAYTADIKFLETIHGIDSKEQRIARCGHSVYQALN